MNVFNVMDLFTNTTITTVTDKAIKMVIQEQLLSFLFNKFDLLSVGNIVLFLLLIVIEPLRDAIKDPIKNGCDNFINLILYVKDIVFDFFVMFLHKSNVVNEKTEEEKIVVNYDKNFIVALYKWIKKNKESIEYVEKITNINVGHKEDNSLTKHIKVSSIKINNKWYDVDLVFNICVDKNDNIINNTHSHITTLSDLLPNEIKNYITKTINKKTQEEITNIKNKLLLRSDTKHLSFCMAIYTLMKKKYPKLALDTFLLEYILLSTNDKSLTDWKKIVINTNELIFDKYNSYGKEELNEAYKTKWYVLTDYILPSFGTENLNIYQIILQNKLNNGNTFNIFSEVNPNIITELTNELYNNADNTSQVFSIGVKKVIKKKTIVANVEYEKWLKKKTVVTSRDYSTAMSDFIKMEVPDETVEVIEYETVLDIIPKDFVNNDIDTLYLDGNDKNKLINMLSRFRDNKELYTQLSIPHKINLFLYGNSGCGKTYCIRTVATYLNRDIYYINLVNVKTVDDLDMIFNYIKSNTLKKGIIVFENIDSNKLFMKSIVKNNEEIDISDEESSKSSKSNKTKNDKTKDKKKKEVQLNIIENLTVNHIIDRISGLLGWDDMVCITTACDIDLVDETIYNNECYNQIITFSSATHDQIKDIYKKIKGKEITEELTQMYNGLSVQKVINDFDYEDNL